MPSRIQAIRTAVWLAGVIVAKTMRAEAGLEVSQCGRQDLMGTWSIAIVPEEAVQAEINALEKAQWIETRAPFLLSRLPGMNPEKAEAVRYAWARREFTAPDETAWRNAVLHLHGVRWGSRIWLNGKEIGGHLGAYGAFEFDVSAAINWGGKNELLLRLTGWPEIPRSKAEDPTHVEAFPLMPHGAACFRWGNRQAGIVGGVWIDYFDYSRLQDVQIVADPTAGKVELRGIMKNYSRQFGQRWIRPTVVTPEGKEIVGERIAVPWPNTLFRRIPYEFTAELSVENPQSWSPDAPVLYQLRLELVQEDRVLHRWMEHFGFRTFEARSVTPAEASRGAQGAFYFNGERIFLRGICTVGEPHLFAEPAERELLLRRTLVELPRAANLNCIRNHTVPLGPDVLNVLDRYGMMLLQEFPITMNYRNPLLTSEERALYHEQCLKEFRSLLPLYWNHPSVIIWVPTNESGFDNEWENGELYRLYKETDPTRPVMRAGEPSPDVFDTHCYDGFWNGPEGKFDLAVAAALARGRATGKPVTITEYIENFRVGKWLGPKPEELSNEEWEQIREDSYAQFILEQTEVLRRLGYNGTLPYMWGRAYVRNLDRAQEPPALTPAYYALRSAQSPVLASFALADRHFVAGRPLDVELVLCDDTGSNKSRKVQFFLVKGNPGFVWPDQDRRVTILWEKKVTGAPGRFTLTCPLPANPGRYYLLAVVPGGEGRPSAVSRRVLEVVPPPDAARLKGQTIGVLGPSGFSRMLATFLPTAKIVDLEQEAEALPRLLLVGPHIHTKRQELKAVANRIPSSDFWAQGGRLVVLHQDRPIPELELDIPRVDGLGGASTAFWTGNPKLRVWEGYGRLKLMLRRFNGPTGAVVRQPLKPREGDEIWAVAAQEGNELNWPILVRRCLGRGEIIFCQLVLSDHLEGPHVDPLAQAILINLLAFR
ncbi:MAG: glycoside hydrolase family 2 protein [Kiritimatiellia bacterium]